MTTRPISKQLILITRSRHIVKSPKTDKGYKWPHKSTSVNISVSLCHGPCIVYCLQWMRLQRRLSSVLVLTELKRLCDENSKRHKHNSMNIFNLLESRQWAHAAAAVNDPRTLYIPPLNTAKKQALVVTAHLNTAIRNNIPPALLHVILLRLHQRKIRFIPDSLLYTATEKPAPWYFPIILDLYGSRFYREWAVFSLECIGNAEKWTALARQLKTRGFLPSL